MMNVEHRALDGARVAITADADLSREATASGWAVVPSLGRAHPFTIYPRGHGEVLEQAARSAPATRRSANRTRPPAAGPSSTKHRLREHAFWDGRYTDLFILAVARSTWASLAPAALGRDLRPVTDGTAPA